MVSLTSRLPDIDLLPGDGSARAAVAAPPPPWLAPPAPEIERLDPPAAAAPRRRATVPRVPRGPRRTIWPQPARRSPAPAPRLAAPAAASPPVPRATARPAAAAPAAELEIPAFLARPRPAPSPGVAPAFPAPAPRPAPLPRTRARARPARPRRGLAAAAAVAVVGLAALAAAVGLAGQGDGGAGAPPPSRVPRLTAAAAAEIPREYLALYQQFGLKMDIDWRFLAAIGAQESNHGRDPAADRVNPEGCVGPMQLGVGGRCGDFVGTWGVDANGDGRVNPLDPADAIATAARGLREGKGAPARGGSAEAYRQAACGYYGACADARADYADEVMARAASYGFPAG